MKLEQILNEALLSKDQIVIEDAFSQIYEQYHKLVYYLVIGILKNPEDAEEVTNDVFLKAFKNITCFKPHTSLKSWLAQIAKNEAINRYHQNERKERILKEEYVDDLATQDKFYQFRMEFEKVLEPNELDILIWRIYFNMTFQEIASLNDTTVSIVYKTYQKGIKKLKIYYQKESQDERSQKI